MHAPTSASPSHALPNAMLHTEYVLWPVCLAGRVTGRILQGRCPASELLSNPSVIHAGGRFVGGPPEETQRDREDGMG